MGNVVALIKIMPDSTDRDLKELQEKLRAVVPAGTDLKSIELKPIAFGLKALMCTVVVNDDVGGTEPVEAAWAKVEGVESLSIEGVGRML
jgi:elongation factor 1-beta